VTRSLDYHGTTFRTKLHCELALKIDLRALGVVVRI
jgi:hypothetical protein